MKHIFKSSEPDLKNKISVNKLDIMAGNILYMTHEIDKIRSDLIKLARDLALTKQADEYYETSPQTDTFEQNPPVSDLD